MIGFGDQVVTPPSGMTRYEKSVLASIAGAAVGGAIGAVADKGAGAIIGAIVGAVGAGGAVYAANAAPAGATPSVPGGSSTPPLLPAPVPAPAPVTSNWRLLKNGDQVNLEQQIAVTISAPNMAPIPQNIVSVLNSASGDVITSTGIYPPGTPPPSDWPSDDNFGPNAFRVMVAPPVVGYTFDSADLLRELPMLAGFSIVAWVR